MKKTLLIWNTIKYLKLSQLFFQVKYLLRNKIYPNFLTKEFEKQHLQPDTNKITFNSPFSLEESFNKNEFTFLNTTIKFPDQIDWNYSKKGKLWTYNLNYFDFLLQEKITTEQGTNLIIDFINNTPLLKDGLEPYPISLRGINWIKFLSKNDIQNNKINNHLSIQYTLLSKQLEYHILGNHLLENGLSLLFGAYYHQNKDFYKTAKKIITKELNEQVLNDGGHFELSPMYHQILLIKILDSYQLIKKNNTYSDNVFEDLLNDKITKMLSWISTVTFKNDEIPLVNDASQEIAPKTQQIISYAKSLGFPPPLNNILSDSGYRKKIKDKYELFIDIGKIGPKYQPGHAHADTFNFVLYVNEKPFIIDPGVSTYEKNEQRQLERSTCFHNTIEVNETNSSQVWGGFRVANRAKVFISEDSPDIIKAKHDGYKQFNCQHERSWQLQNDSITIKDEVQLGVNKANGFLHFHPEINLQIINNTIIGKNFEINFSNVSDLKKHTYLCPVGYNKFEEAQKISYKPTDKSEFTIKLSS